MIHVRLATSFALATLAAASPAQVSVPPGFTSSSIPIGTQVSGLAVGDGGAFGSDLYVARTGAILRVDPGTGAQSTFATGLGVSTARPSGLAFDSGAFGTGRLYCVQNSSLVYEFQPDSTRTTLTSGGTLFSSNGITFAPPATAFGPVLFVANGSGGSSTVSSVDAAGANAVFSPATQYVSSPVGLDFPSASSAFVRDLYVVAYVSGTLYRTDSTGAATPFATGLGQSIDLAFNTLPSSPFGDFAFVTDALGDRIFRVDASGAASVFATGIAMSNSGWDADLAFSPDGQTLFVAAGNDVVVIRVACTAPTAYCTGKVNSLGCTPAIDWTGSPDVSGASDFVITCSNVLELKSGLLFYGFAAAAAPFQGGFLCAQQPIRRTPTQIAFGPGGCGSMYAFDFDAYIRSGVDPLLASGAGVFAQWWMRDPQSPSTTGLSNAVDFQICP